MRNLFLIISFLLLTDFSVTFSQQGSGPEVYLLTCGQGSETYSIYGHSALRIVNRPEKSDIVYNWGVFDFNTSNFAWKFARGRLDYMLGVESMQDFLKVYIYEKRFVHSQRINLTADEAEQLISLVNENLKPGNIKYRYDFFYDDCSTRIRDLIEKSVGEKLLYLPADGGKKMPTFRNLVGKYQNPYPWLKFGVDLIMGSPGDKKAQYRDRMFLPVELQKELSETVINRDGKMIPLLRNPDPILDYNLPGTKQKFFLIPGFVFTLILVIILILSSLIKSRKIINSMDILIFSVFSILSVLMIFFNFFTDHQQMRWNLNIIWLNPLIPVCLVALILSARTVLWFRFLFYILVAFLFLHLVLPQSFNIAILPLLLILIIRSSARSGFRWNPHSIN